MGEDEVYSGQVVSIDADEERSKCRLVDLASFARECQKNIHRVMVSGLSAEGCQITGSGDFDPEGQLWVKIAGLLALRAEVISAKDGHVDCRFVSTLDQASLDHLAVLSRQAAKNRRGYFGRPAAPAPSARQ